MRQVDDLDLRPLRDDEVNAAAGGFFVIRFPVATRAPTMLEGAAGAAIKSIGDALGSAARSS